MDSTTRILVMMILIAVVFGVIVVKKNPDFRINKILETNKNYYPALAGRYK